MCCFELLFIFVSFNTISGRSCKSAVICRYWKLQAYPLYFETSISQPIDHWSPCTHRQLSLRWRDLYRWWAVILFIFFCPFLSFSSSSQVTERDCGKEPRLFDYFIPQLPLCFLPCLSMIVVWLATKCSLPLVYVSRSLGSIGRNIFNAEFLDLSAGWESKAALSCFRDCWPFVLVGQWFYMLAVYCNHPKIFYKNTHVLENHGNPDCLVGLQSGCW